MERPIDRVSFTLSDGTFVWVKMERAEAYCRREATKERRLERWLNGIWEYQNRRAAGEIGERVRPLSG